MDKLCKIRHAVMQKSPLIHCITNPISINQCANALLAVGARPIMAEHPREVREITETADALVLNLGNITDARMESMKIAFQTAKEKKIPVIVDAVGAACSGLRRDYFEKLMTLGTADIIKGNYSEIYALDHAEYRSNGVDAALGLEKENVMRAACGLSKKHRAAILASGKTDLVADGCKILEIRNGSPQLSFVTGTGCMLGALCGAYLSAAPGASAAAAACAVLGICGQLAQTQKGSGSFMVSLMDALCTLTDEEAEKYMDAEETAYEEL